jgi:small-conductance mechanosensitive channel
MSRFNFWIRILLVLTLFVFLAAGSFAQDKPATVDSGTEVQSASLVINNKRLVTFYTPLDGLTPDERVERAMIVFNHLNENPNFNVDTIHAVDGKSGTDIVSGDQRIATITEGDAESAHGNTKLVANDFILKAKYAFIKKSAAQDAPSMALDIAFCIIGLLVLALLTAIICRIAISACDMLRNMRRRSSLHGIRIQDAELVSSDTLLDLATTAIKLSQLILICFLIATYVLVSLSFFPNTRPITDALVESARIPIVSFGDSIIDYLPKLFTIAVIAIITYGFMFIARFFFNAVRDGSIRLADFDPDWAEPSYKLARFILIFFALVCALPYLPGWDTPAFKQVGLLLGLLISLGSSSAISNMMAGIVLTYTNAFRLGDRVRVAEHIGDVLEKRLRAKSFQFRMHQFWRRQSPITVPRASKEN